MIKDNKDLSLLRKIKLWWPQIKLKVIKKEWTPEAKDTEFCCIICGRVHQFLTTFDSSNPITNIFHVKDSKAKKLYNLDFCSTRCLNKVLREGKVRLGIQLFNLDKIHSDLDSGYWRKRWVNLYKHKKKKN